MAVLKTVVSAFAFTLFATLVMPQTALCAPDGELDNLTIESLMEMTVTSVSKKSQPITTAAAAVFVISQDDIRRSGVTTIADALRMVPGVQVYRIDANKWAVTARGFNGRFANKLLVLMDGRSLYTPYFMGVYWEAQDTVLEDIDRIEVIRGPGAALWGSNAVNGVINIITKSADKTRGALIAAGGGMGEKAFATARYGAAIGDTSNIRLYVKHQTRDGFVDASGDDTNDSWYTTQGGFRLDSQLNSSDSLTVQGDYYDGVINESFVRFNYPASSEPFPYRILQSRAGMNGGNILTRWQHSVSASDNFSLQLYYDHSERNMLVSPQKFNTVDLDFQHKFAFGGRQDVIWGVGYRFNQYELVNTPTLTFNDQRVVDNLFSGFIHDEISLIPSALSLIIGSRFEHNDHSGFDIQPNGRLLWAITPHNSAWASVSRAVRSATKGEQDILYRYRTVPVKTDQNRSDPFTKDPNPFGVPYRLEIVGNKDFKSEELLAYELGFRSEPATRFSVDVTAYYNLYKRLRVVSPSTPYRDSQGTPVLPYMLSNDMHGHAVGAELAFDWSPFDWWRLQASYSYQNLVMALDGSSSDTTNRGNAAGNVPQHQFSVRSGFDVGRQVTLDLWLRGADRLASTNGISLPGYVTSDIRGAWKPFKGLELSMVGQNLFGKRQPGFIPEYVFTLPTETGPTFYGKVAWKF
ncbi:MAG: TonB-dependent receptor [Desulfuromonadales bacterium]